MTDLEGEVVRQVFEAARVRDLECDDCCYRFQTTGRKGHLVGSAEAKSIEIRSEFGRLQHAASSEYVVFDKLVQLRARLWGDMHACYSQGTTSLTAGAMFIWHAARLRAKDQRCPGVVKE
jgi:hypothetical protein